MQPSALRALEFDRIVEAVSGFALTPMGAERLRGCAVDRSAAGRAAGWRRPPRPARFVTAHGAVPAPRVERPAADSRRAGGRGARARIAAAPRAGRPSSIRSTRRAPASAARPDRFRCSMRPAPAPRRSRAKRRRCARRSTRRARSSITRARSCKAIRERLRKQRTRLRSTLESYLRGKETAKYLQDQVVTERNGRKRRRSKPNAALATPSVVDA